MEMRSETEIDVNGVTNGDHVNTIPNWRVVPKSKEDVDSPESVANMRSLLMKRAKWSEDVYQRNLQLYHDFMACQDSYVAGNIEAALQTLDHAYRVYGGPDSVLCSFNGGKDAVVILYLILAATAKFYKDHPNIHRNRPRVIYFENADEFPEVLSFLHDTVESNDLEMIAFGEGTKFQHGLEIMVKHNLPSAVIDCMKAESVSATSATVSWPMAFVLGTRVGDPNAGNQEQFAPSSHYMPPFMRVNPILSWTYGHVWHFLRLFQLPYCSLYDQGYTSLGTVKDTLPCPALAVAGRLNDNETTSIPKYWPAYMLRDWDQERAGRISKKKKSNTKKEAAVKKKAEEDSSERKEPTDGSVASSVGRLSTMTYGRFAPNPAEIDEMEQQAKTTPAPSPLQGERTPTGDTTLVTGNLKKNGPEVEADVVSYSDDETTKSVGVLIIGDEILKGYTVDTNSQVAAKALREQNVLLRRVVFVSDDLEDIVREINSLQQQVDVIITSGGVGPTHDDVTIKSVAAALNSDVVFHEEMAQLLRDKMNKQKDDGEEVVELTDAQKKMALLPRASKLRYLSNNPQDWPVLQCKNIFILPGVPEFFAEKIVNVAEYLSCQLERGTAYKVVLSVEESTIVPFLNKVVENHPGVSFGSYPFVSHPDYKTVITVEGRIACCDKILQREKEIFEESKPETSDAPPETRPARSNSAVFDRDLLANTSSRDVDEMVRMALDELINTLPPNSVLRVDNDDMTLFS